MAKIKDLPENLQNLIAEYLSWQEKRGEAEKQLDFLKKEIVLLAQKEKIKKINTEQCQLLIVSQSETRFPQIGEPGRKEVERIVQSSKEAQKVMVFDIISLGNLYDQGKLSPQLMEKLEPFAKKAKTTKIVIRPFSKTARKT